MTPVVIALIAAGAGLIVLLAIRSSRLEKARAEAMRSRAASLGFTYQETNSAADMGSTLPLFARGRRQRVQNVYGRADRDIETLVFDYAYTTGSGKSQSTHRQTVALFKLPDGDLPGFEVSPEHVFHRVAGAFGYQDIDFDASPDFSRAYLVRGADEDRVRTVLGPSARHILERERGWSAEGGGRALVVYRSGTRIDPEDLTTFLEHARQVRQAIAGR
jgi:hypothetical protein